MRISFTQFSRQGVNAINDQLAGLAHTQLQLATQKRVLTPSEDPVASTQIANYKNDLSLFDRFQKNAETAQGHNELEDTLLSQSQDVMGHIRELILQAGNGSLTSTERQAMASEAQIRLQELIGISNTRNAQGEYVFSGFQTGTQPFTLNAAGGIVYNGDQGVREISTSGNINVAISDPGFDIYGNIKNGNGDFTVTATAGNTGGGVMGPGSVADRTAYVPDTYTLNFYINGTGQTVFDVNGATAGNVITGQVYVPDAAISFNGISTVVTGTPASGDTFVLAPSTSQDIFTTIQQAITAFGLPDTTAAQRAQMRVQMDQALSSLDQGLNNFDKVRAQIGARLNVVDAELDHNQSAQLQTRTTLSKLEDLDAVSAITKLQQQTTALDAAQKSFASVQGLSLFKYL